MVPFEIKGVDMDKGREFLNWHFRAYFKKRKEEVELICYRAYNKKDQVHIEQKNYTHVRQPLGYDRLGYEELVGPLNAIMGKWSQLNNLYSARMDREEKRHERGRLIRKHEKWSQMPSQRLIKHWRQTGREAKAKKDPKRWSDHRPEYMIHLPIFWKSGNFENFHAVEIGNTHKLSSPFFPNF